MTLAAAKVVQKAGTSKKTAQKVHLAVIFYNMQGSINGLSRALD